MRDWFHRTVLGRRWLCFMVLGLSFFVFGAMTLNLVSLLTVSTNLVLEYGWQALMDGAARQLGELLLSAYAGMAAYVVFKACEIRLVQWLSAPPQV
ncbi:MAG: hypothetical protein ABI574_02965 [Burkholderiales bacterium]